MTKVFSRHPVLSLLAVLLAMAVGAEIAHRRGMVRATPLPMSLPPQPAPAAPDWRAGLDLNQGAAQGEAWVQTLADGTAITYTLDPELQSWTHELLRSFDLPYAAVVLFHLPSQATKIMTGFSSADLKLRATDLCLHPWAPAASVFKLITAAALLEQGVPPDTSVCYHGGLSGLDESNLLDRPALDKSCRSLADAVAFSINPIMAKLATRYLSPESITHWTTAFGFNNPGHFALPLPASRAEVPNDQLERARMAAGFWHVELSALHAAVIAGIPANGGELVWPRVIDHVRLPDGTETQPEAPQAVRVVSQRTALELTQMMITTTEQGSGRAGFFSGKRRLLESIKVAGKTGSLSRKNPYLAYSWFVGFAPATEPEVAFAVLLGNPVQWRVKAARIAQIVLAHYFARTKTAASPAATTSMN